jgi:hypothetical protein
MLGRSPTHPRRTLRRLALATASALTWGVGAAGAQTLSAEEIQDLHATFDDDPLLGGQVPPRRPGATERTCPRLSLADRDGA